MAGYVLQGDAEKVAATLVAIADSIKDAKKVAALALELGLEIAAVSPKIESEKQFFGHVLASVIRRFSDK